MPQITLDATDAAELAQTLTFLTNWLTGTQKQTLAASFAVFAGHPAYTTDTLTPTCTDSPSSAAKPTAKNSSARQRHERQHRHGAPA